jgi:hypothetical protein
MLPKPYRAISAKWENSVSNEVAGDAALALTQGLLALQSWREETAPPGPRVVLQISQQRSPTPMDVCTVGA